MFLFAIMIQKGEEAVMNVIKTLPILAQLPPNEVKQLISEIELYTADYVKGATVHDLKDSCTTLDVVLSGSLVAYSLSENGSAMTMFVFSEGQMLGANLLFGDDHAYPFTIYCMSDSRILHITKEAVSSFLHDYGFAMQFIGMLSQNAQKLNRRITMATQKTLRENLLEYLRQQSVAQHSNRIVLPISKKQLADHLGVQRPSLFRQLKCLKDEGVIDVFNRTILLNSVEEFGDHE